MVGVISLGCAILGAGYYLVVRDPIKSSEAVAVLSGGGIERMDHAAKLIEQNYAKRLIITETGSLDPSSGTKISKLMEEQAAQRGIRKVYVNVTDGESRSTREEAYAILKLMQTKEWGRVIVVTDSFHSRRTKVIFTDIFRGTGIRVSVNPVDAPDYWYHPATWWVDAQSREATIYEYISLISYKLGIFQETDSSLP